MSTKPNFKTVYICINKETGFTLYNKTTGIWNDKSKPNLMGNRVWTFSIKQSGLNSPTILKAREHLAKLGFKNIEFVKVEVDAKTQELPLENTQEIATN